MTGSCATTIPSLGQEACRPTKAWLRGEGRATQPGTREASHWPPLGLSRNQGNSSVSSALTIQDVRNTPSHPLIWTSLTLAPGLLVSLPPPPPAAIIVCRERSLLVLPLPPTPFKGPWVPGVLSTRDPEAQGFHSSPWLRSSTCLCPRSILPPPLTSGPTSTSLPFCSCHL